MTRGAFGMKKKTPRPAAAVAAPPRATAPSAPSSPPCSAPAKKVTSAATIVGGMGRLFRETASSHAKHLPKRGDSYIPAALNSFYFASMLRQSQPRIRWRPHHTVPNPPKVTGVR